MATYPRRASPFPSPTNFRPPPPTAQELADELLRRMTIVQMAQQHPHHAQHDVVAFVARARRFAIRRVRSVDPDRVLQQPSQVVPLPGVVETNPQAWAQALPRSQ